MQFVASMFVVLGLGVLPGVAWASPPEAQLLGESPECVVPGPIAQFDIPVQHAVMTALHFPGEILEGRRPDGWERHFSPGIRCGKAPAMRRRSMSTEQRCQG